MPRRFKGESTLDRVVSVTIGLGVPGLVLLVAMGASGWAGAAAITTALARSGEPLGMLGGMASLAVLVLISRALAECGFETVFVASVKKSKERSL